MLEVQLLETGAKMPTIANPGEDLAYDIYALEDVWLPYGQVTQVRTGIAVAAYSNDGYHEPMGLIIEDRSSMASKGVVKSAGVIDAGYRGEIKVLLTYWGKGALGTPFGYKTGYQINAGDKITQMRPTPVLTGPIKEVTSLQESQRGHKGFGSSGS